MKMFNKRVIALLLAVITVVFVASCQRHEGKIEGITLTEYSTPLEFHTSAQAEYIYGERPLFLDISIDGKAEKSRPEAITLTWENSKTCEYYSVYLSENADMSGAEEYATKGESVSIYNLKAATKYYWKVKEALKDGRESAVGSFTTAEGPRNLYIDGITNVRDVGGWKTQSGTRVKQGLLFRGGRLNESYPDGWVKGGDDTGYKVNPEITADGIKAFKKLGIKTEIDLREKGQNGYPGTTDEVTYSMVDGVNYIAIPMDGGADVEISKEQIKAFFTVLADRNNYPMYYHCNIGTDRTGMVTYLLNALLGVSDHDLYVDYMFSNFGVIAKPSKQVSNPTRKELFDLTTYNKSKKKGGAAYRVALYPGDTLSEQAENCLLDCDVTAEQIAAIKAIML